MGRSLSATLCFCMLGACETADPPATPAVPRTEPAPPPVESAEAATPRYTVAVDSPPQTCAGTEAMAKVEVIPHAPWHMNLDFPASLRLEAPAEVRLVASEQRKEDAERLDEDGLVFAVPLTSSTRGDKRIEGQLRFAVCGDAECAPVFAPVTIEIPVAC